MTPRRMDRATLARDLRRELRKQTNDELVEHLVGIAERARERDFSQHPFPGIKRVQAALAKLRIFGRDCERLATLYDSLDEDAQQTVSYFFDSSRVPFGDRVRNLASLIASAEQLSGRGPGRPRDTARDEVAEAVAWVLLSYGVLSRAGSLSRKPDGTYGRLLATVLDAADLPVAEDLSRAIDRAATRTEWLWSVKMTAAAKTANETRAK